MARPKLPSGTVYYRDEAMAEVKWISGIGEYERLEKESGLQMDQAGSVDGQRRLAYYSLDRDGLLPKIGKRPMTYEEWAPLVLWLYDEDTPGASPEGEA